MDTLARELRRGTLELLLLRLLVEEKQYGYRLVTEIRNRSDGLIAVKEGTVYPVLYRLEEQGHIEPTWENRERGVPRKYYRLTRSGRARLEELQEEWTRFTSIVDSLLNSPSANSFANSSANSSERASEVSSSRSPEERRS